MIRKNKIEFIFQNSIFTIIKKGFISLMPLSIVVSVFTLLLNCPIPDFFKALCLTVSHAFNSIISIYVLISMSYNMALEKKQNVIPTVLSSLFVFFIFTSSNLGESNYQINSAYLDTNGVFIAMIVSILVPYVLERCNNIPYFKLNLTNIPKEVNESINSIIPQFLTICLSALLNVALIELFDCSISEIVVISIQKPLLFLGNNVFSILIINIIICFLWFIGLNGTSLVNSVIMPILSTLTYQNLTNTQLGIQPSNIITGSFQNLFVHFGGCGSTLALILAILLFSKNAEIKTKAKLAIIPSLFNINEPILYGLPVIMNVKILTPFFVCPFINVLISYLCMSINIVNKTNGVIIPWTTPVLLSGFLSCGLSGTILQFVLICINIAVYSFAIKKLDES